MIKKKKKNENYLIINQRRKGNKLWHTHATEKCWGKKSYCKSALQHRVYRKFKNMQNNYIIYGNKYIQDSVYLWGMKGGGKEKGTQRIQLHGVLLLFKKKQRLFFF